MLSCPPSDTKRKRPSSDGKGSDGELSVPQTGNFWSTPIQVGNVTLNTIIDTASALTLVDGKVYVPGPTSRDTKKPYHINFQDGSVSEGEVCAPKLLRWRHSVFLTQRAHSLPLGIQRHSKDCAADF